MVVVSLQVLLVQVELMEMMVVILQLVVLMVVLEVVVLVLGLLLGRVEDRRREESGVDVGGHPLQLLHVRLHAALDGTRVVPGRRPPDADDGIAAQQSPVAAQQSPVAAAVPQGGAVASPPLRGRRRRRCASGRLISGCWSSWSSSSAFLLSFLLPLLPTHDAE